MRRVDFFDAPEKTVLAIGGFDGVHTAHRVLLSQAVRRARAEGLAPAVFTFAGGLPQKDAALMTDEERLSIFREAGVARVFLFSFSEVSEMMPDVFFCEVLSRICRASAAVCGENFRFGKGASGDASLLGSFLPTLIIPSITDGEGVISSTRIRRAVRDGDMPLAARLLGMPYTLTGRVTHGRRLGHTLGFPTANIDLSESLCLPKHGVYAARVGVGESSYPAVANIGVRPTVTADGTVNCESHLIGFSGDLYGKEIRVSLIAFLREEKQFASQNELRLQIDCDRKEAEKWLNSVGHS